MGHILALVEHWTSYSPSELRSSRRHTEIAAARMMAYYIMTRAGYISREIGMELKRTNSAVRHGVRCVREVITESPSVARMMRGIEAELGVVEC
jgi:chromosomal replication initiation ATPase DnaA